MSAIALTLVFFIFYLLNWQFHRRRLLPLPPGPNPYPIIGNLFHIPRKTNPGERFLAWSKSYGEIIYMHVFGREFVVLNSSKAALELFDHRGAFYSDRPHLVMAGDLVGRGDSVLFHQYGDQLRKHRKLLRNALNSHKSTEYWSMQELESWKLMSALIKNPNDFIDLLRRNAGAVTLRMTYGYEIESYTEEDRFITLAEELAGITTKASEPGYWLVDSFQWLQYIPTWFPGAGFRRWALWARQKSEEFTNAPYDFAKAHAANGSGLHSFTTETYESLQEERGLGSMPIGEEDEKLLKWTAASIYAGGTDTTVALITAFYLYMVLYPDVQRKAQAEIDEVVGRDRLPTMEDEKRLPYIGALIKELHRFNPIVPLIPHSTSCQDEYRGYRIPKGAWIMANSWAIMRDPNEFPDPNKFWPERYLEGHTTVDPRDYSFGYGRRRCPGMHFANSSIFITVAHTLAVLSISPPSDPTDRPLLDFSYGHVSHPKPFQCNIQPRSAAVADLVYQVLADHS
ncbi:hypothetical protein CVT25_001491 [Psilocybe cyanescens]|uniref:Cytochrome P450 n=1 Tax=Psilocybe cyanescens TaxID=93625 RepID=A0A409WNJ2_PSICY|nr:hypothetical protein CVT25_001491 [Psilocybe cyanescens]